MNDITFDRYDSAVDKQDYYSDIHDKLSDVLYTLFELDDPMLDAEAIEDMMDYASTKLREYRELVETLGKQERKREMAEVGFYDM